MGAGVTQKKEKKRNIFLGACDEIISRASLASVSVCIWEKRRGQGFSSVGARWGKNNRIVLYKRFPGKNRHERALASACGYGTSHIARTRRSPEREHRTQNMTFTSEIDDCSSSLLFLKELSSLLACCTLYWME